MSFVGIFRSKIPFVRTDPVDAQTVDPVTGHIQTRRPYLFRQNERFSEKCGRALASEPLPALPYRKCGGSPVSEFVCRIQKPRLKDGFSDSGFTVIVRNLCLPLVNGTRSEFHSRARDKDRTAVLHRPAVENGTAGFGLYHKPIGSLPYAFSVAFQLPAKIRVPINADRAFASEGFQVIQGQHVFTPALQVLSERLPDGRQVPLPCRFASCFQAALRSASPQ